MKTEAKKTDGKAVANTVEMKNFLMIPPKEIIVDEKTNPREEYGEIEELMTSIVENGMRNPVKCFKKDGKIYLREGFRRMRAVKFALKNGKQIERIPVLMEERPLSEEERTLEFLINNDGKPFTMLEQSEVINRLLNFGWKVTEIVKKTGKARGYIENLILLTRIPMKIHNFIKDDKISAHAVIQIMQAVKGDGDKALSHVEEAIKSAKEAGKNKATPKHVKTKEVQNQSFGKFYKWAISIADGLAGGNGVIKERAEVLEKLLVSFENGKPAGQCAEEFFMIKTSKEPAIKTTSKKKQKK